MGQEIIGRRTIRRWLDNWEHIQRREPMEDQVKVNSGCKPADGITNGMLNKIMLEMAYDRLPLELRRVAYYRWVIKGQYSLLQTLTILGLTTVAIKWLILFLSLSMGINNFSSFL